jgi:hypothetical protein
LIRPVGSVILSAGETTLERDAVAADRVDLEEWVCEALRHHGGEASVLDVSKYVWHQHGDQLRFSGNLFYTWQYDIRWAAKKLRDSGKLVAAEISPRGRSVLS